jgi:hypothetical protein
MPANRKPGPKGPGANTAAQKRAAAKKRAAGGSAFDPWTATLEEVLELPADADGEIPVQHLQWMHARSIAAQQLKIERGDGFDVLQAVAACAIHGLVMPDWLVREYLRRYRAVQQCRVKSWDALEAFGRPYPKGTHIQRLRKDRGARHVVLHIARRIL